MVELEKVKDQDKAELLDLISEHKRLTGSAVASSILDSWDEQSTRIVKVMPREYQRVLLAQETARREGIDPIEAIMEATNG